jgi:hypothetical protein
MSHTQPSLPKKYSHLENSEVKSIPNDHILNLKWGKEYAYLWHWNVFTMDHLIGIYIKEFKFNYAIVVAPFDEKENYTQVLSPVNNASKLWYFI